jgi:hypothetical protein
MVYRQAALKLGRLAPVSLAGFAGSYSIAKNTSSSCEPSHEQSENLQSWHDRWSTGNFRWHKLSVDRSLEEKLSDQTLKLPSNARVLVPLCGKSVDMAYLSRLDQVQQVVGVDGIRKALEEFATENPDLNVQPVAPLPKFEKLQGQSIVDEQFKRLYEGQPWVESVECIDSKSPFGSEPWYKAAFLYLRMGNVQEKIFLIRAKK